MRVYRKTQRFTVIDGYYLTTEITEITEDTEILMFYLRLISADSAISALKIHFFDSLMLDVEVSIPLLLTSAIRPPPSAPSSPFYGISACKYKEKNCTYKSPAWSSPERRVNPPPGKTTGQIYEKSMSGLHHKPRNR